MVLQLGAGRESYQNLTAVEQVVAIYILFMCQVNRLGLHNRLITG
jgi:hypothetical protein